MTPWYQLTGRHVAEIRAVAAPLIAGPLYTGLLLLAVVVALTWPINRVQRSVTTVIDVPRPLVVVRTSLGLAAISAVMVTSVALSSDAMTYGLRRTPAGALAAQMLDRLSDFDRDGYGLLQNPRDTAPFDPQSTRMRSRFPAMEWTRTALPAICRWIVPLIVSPRRPPGRGRRGLPSSFSSSRVFAPMPWAPHTADAK